MRIDVHAHYYPQRYLDCLTECRLPNVAALNNLRAGDAGGQLEERLALMDNAGVAMQVLSAGAHGPYFQDQSEAIKAAQVANDTYAEAARRFSGRFGIFAAVPVPHVDASLREIARAMDQLGMVGVCLPTSVAGKSIVDPAFEPIYQELDRRRAPIFIHPAGAGGCSPLVQEYGLTWMIGAPIEDTIVVMQLIVKQIPIRYPNLKIIAAHLGGAMPLLLDRLAHLGNFGPKLAEPANLTARRIWYDTVDHNSIPALRCACETLGTDRLVLGSDYPYQRETLYHGCVAHIEEGLSRSDADRILDRNPSAILGL